MRHSKLRMLCLAVVGFAAALGSSSVGSADPIEGAQRFNVNLFRDNPAILFDRSAESMFLPLGEVTTNRTFLNDKGEESRERGSAFLVSPCYIVTNHHVVYGNVLPVPGGVDYTMKFMAGPHATATFAGDTMATPVVSGKRDYDGSGDWTLMKLRECIGGAPWNFGWFELASAPGARLTGLKVGVAGYAAGYNPGQLVLGRGEVTGVSSENRNILFSAPMKFGQSGGPIFTMVGGVLKVIGINVRQRVTLADKGNYTFDSYSLERANEFQNIYDVVNDPRVRPLIDADRAGKVNSHTERLVKPAQF